MQAKAWPIPWVLARAAGQNDDDFEVEQDHASQSPKKRSLREARQTEWKVIAAVLETVIKQGRAQTLRQAFLFHGPPFQSTATLPQPLRGSMLARLYRIPLEWPQPQRDRVFVDAAWIF